MLEEFNRLIREYQNKWDALVRNQANSEFFSELKPTAIGWKVTDLAELDKLFAELRDSCDQIHQAWINDRWLLTMHLKGTKLEWGIEVIKLMQRRPGSTDKVGLDHIDFFTEQDIMSVIEKEPNLKWSKESNNPLCSWMSIWFADTEAKLRNNTVLDVCIKEMQQTENQILVKTKV